MKCKRCRARSPLGAVNCWACGVRLDRPGRPRTALAFQPNALRHYSATAAAEHRLWMDGLVLISTVLFGLLLGYFMLEVLPSSGAQVAGKARQLSLRSPLSFFSPAPRLLAVQPLGQPVEAQGIVAQVVDPRRTAAEGGREASAGQAFLTVTVVIDNQGKQTLSYGLQDWQVRDSKGRVHAAESIRGAGWLSGGTVEPGQHVQAQVAFLISEAEASPQIDFGPSALRAVLRWDASPPPVE